MPALLAPTYAERCLWQAQVDPPATSPGSLPSSVDVVVAGAGYCGLSAAETLARSGRSVLVLDREPLGWGASSRNGGMVIPELKAEPELLERRYGPLGRRMHDEVDEGFAFVEALVTGADGRGGVDCDYVRSGQLYLAHSERHVDHLRRDAQERADRGEPDRFLSRGELAEEIGSDAFFGALLYQRTGSLHPAKFHAGLAARALASGALIHDRTAVSRISRRGSGHIVSTTRGEVRAADVVVATNAYADAALPWLARRVLPVGSFIIATEALDPGLAATVSPRGRMFVDTKHLLFYWRLTPDGRLAFGGRRSLDPVDVPAARDYLYGEMVRIHPQLAGTAIEYAWGGNVAMTLDRLPHAGRAAGAWYATGCNGSGVMMNTWLGHRLALWLLGEAAPPSFSELRHRPIPIHPLAPSYLPVVSRWFSWQDRR